MKKFLYGLIMILSLLTVALSKKAYANDISQIDRSFIIRNEGLVLLPYRDSANLSTICVGHLVTSGEVLKKSYTVPECMQIFEKDLTLAVIENNMCLNTYQNDNQFTAVIDFQFNIGERAACSSSLFRNIKTFSSDKIIYNDFLMWRYVTINGKLVPVEGLTLRREREADLYIK